ncbi:MAG: TrkA C-terminal domain-containing protein [Deltaproteobacteria bacterium]
METLGASLAAHELLLLFVVMLLGLLLGRLTCCGVRLGTAGVLFAGLALSAWLLPPLGRLELTPQLMELGLVVFVYTVGLTSGPGFFSAWRARALRLNLATLVALACGALVACIGGKLGGLDRGQIVGVFCGALTNTPALGAASDRLLGTGLESHPALGYSVTYPFGVLGALLLSRGFARLERRALAAEQRSQTSARAGLESADIEITDSKAIGQSLAALRVRDVVGVVVSRLRRSQELFVPTKHTVLARGDVITVVGTSIAIQAAVDLFGTRSKERLARQRDAIDVRGVLVSKHALAGKALGGLDLEQRFNAQVTRLRRADVELVASEDLRLELGDRLRVVAPVAQLAAIGPFFGDSERELAEIDCIALALGLSLGLLFGCVPVPLFGTQLSLGTAGGPLIVALILGRLGRSGPLVWALPYEANHALREFGLLLFLAGVGLSAGGHLDGVLNQRGALMLGLGAAVTSITAAVALPLMHHWAKASVISSLGAVSGLQTQPATLTAAFELSGRSEATYVAYALVYPLAMIGKILIAQIIVAFA